jgi:hypothetical protein
MLASTSHRRERLASLQLPGTVWFGAFPTEPVRHLSTGISALDALLGGGLPLCGLSEITGGASSGRTAIMWALLAAATRRGEMTAVIDLPDALNPESLAAAGADLQRVLWVRPPSLRSSLRCTDLILAAGGFGLVVLDLSCANGQALPLHVWPRLVRLAKQSQTALAILVQQPVTGSFATMSVTLARQRVRWDRGLWCTFEGLATRVVLTRNKIGMPAARSAVLTVHR